MKSILNLIGIEVKHDRVHKKTSKSSVRILGKDMEVRAVPFSLQDQEKRKQGHNPKG